MEDWWDWRARDGWDDSAVLNAVLDALDVSENYEVVEKIDWVYDPMAENVRVNIRLTRNRRATVLMPRAEMVNLGPSMAARTLYDRIERVLRPVRGEKNTFAETPREQADVGEYVIGYRRWLVSCETYMRAGPLRAGVALDYDDFPMSFEDIDMEVNRYRLHPISTNVMDTPWDGGREVLATCVNHRHPAPDPDCHCGLYLWHATAAIANTGSLVTGAGWMVPGGNRGLRGVRGVARARGRIEVHSIGFRAQYAQPLALIREDEWVEEVARSLGLATVDLADVEDFAREHGTPVPVKLRPSVPLGGSGYSRAPVRWPTSSSGGARGLFQIKTPRRTAAQQREMFDRAANLRAGVKAMSNHFQGMAVDITASTAKLSAAVRALNCISHVDIAFSLPEPHRPPRRNRRHGRPRGRMPRR